MNRPLNVLLAGELPERSAPLLTLGTALEQRGFRPIFSECQESRSWRTWLRLVRRADLVVFVGYGGPEAYVLRQLAIAAALGKPLIRWWVGTDVLLCIENTSHARSARLLEKFSAAQIAVAPHLQSELAEVGISATVIPSVTEPGYMAIDTPAGPLPRGVLVYLPASRADFYGEEIVRQAIDGNPDLPFVIVADDDHRFRSRPNVESLGWVSDMGSVYARIGCLLRMTRHDGLPRMVLEALCQGRYVICSSALPGCWRARTPEDVHTYLAAYRNCNGANIEGAGLVRRLLEPPGDVQFAELLKRLASKRSIATRARAALTVAPLTLISRIGSR